MRPPEPAGKTRSQVISAYKAQPQLQASAQPAAQPTPKLSSVGKYVDDQLLSSPGGDRYEDLHEKKVEPKVPHSFAKRVGKDLKDAFGNVRNFFTDLFFGSKFCYRDENNEIKEAKRKGLLGSVVDFFKDMGSAFSFGAWRPDGDEAPKGIGKRLAFSCSKFTKAIATDVFQNIPASVNHMAKDIALAAWNSVEVLPDATIGNIAAGEKLTTTVFDNGQVVGNYLTDITPGGDAWQRVHAFSFKELRPPILNNLQKPETGTQDPRWKTVRNTSFRKTIETVGALLADVLSFSFIKWINSSAQKTRHKN